MHTTLVLPHLSGLILADPQYMDKSHIDMLLRAAVYTRIVEGAFIKGNLIEPLATPSALGWLLSGETPFDSKYQSSQFSSLHLSQDDCLDDLLQTFWIQEKVSSAPLYTKEERECEEHFAKTHFRNADGHYVLRLPIKNPNEVCDVDFTSSCYSARAMLLKLEQRVRSDPKLTEIYHAFLHEFENLGHMRCLSSDEVNRNSHRYYVPHHGFYKKKAPP